MDFNSVGECVMPRLLGEPRHRSYSQHGFVLLAVLAAIAITSIVIAALLAMMLNTIRITANQEQAAREARAADGAVSAAINQLRLNQTNASDACAPGIPTAALGGFSLPFESSGRSDSATVTCSTAADELGTSAGDVKLSGTRYEGSYDWKLWPWPSSLQSSVNVASPTLVHLGGEALKFNGRLSLKAGSAPLRTDSAGTPALEVRGKYDQAASGIGAEVGASGNCGALDGVAALAQTTVRASAGASCGDPLLVPVSVTQDYAIDESVPTSPSLAAGCPAASVVTFSPGKYDQNAVATLNKWFGRGAGGCTNKTFYFPYGRYWFDANTVVSGVPAANQHALIFDNPSSTFVFGKANGWDPAGAGPSATNFPKACDPLIPGASIILSARTEFRHLAGRLAVCPYSSSGSAGGTPYPALLQQTTVPTTVTAKTAVSPSGNFSNPQNLLAGPAATPSASASFRCTFAAGYPAGQTCTSTNKFTVTLSSTMSGAIGSVALNVTGNETNNNVSGVQARTAELTVTLAGSGGSCSVPAAAGAPDKSRIATYELLGGTCRALITKGEQLDGAQVEVSYSYKYARICPLTICNQAALSAAQAQSLTIWNVQVVANPWVGSAASVAATPPTDWVTVDNARVNDTETARMSTLCMPNPVCAARPEQSYTRTFQMADFGNFVGGIVGSSDLTAATSHLQSLGVVIKQLGTQAQGINLSTLPGQTQLTLTLNDAVNPADRTVCTRSFTGVANQAGDNYFPLIGQGESTCGGVQLTSAKQIASVLFGASLTVAYRLDCAIRSGPPNYQCTYFQPVGVQYVGLVATSDSYAGPVIQSRLTVDSAGVASLGAGGGPASANFFGSAYLKNMGLDIHWNGQGSGASLFGGELQLNSLGSSMLPGATTDVVCCTKPETNIRKVRVTASVGGEAKLSAVVALNRDAPTAIPVVLEWTVCGRNGNCSP